MRVMVLVKATSDSERGDLPAAAMLEAMGKFNDSLRAAGILGDVADGLKPSSAGKRVAFDGSVIYSLSLKSWRMVNTLTLSFLGSTARIWTSVRSRAPTDSNQPLITRRRTAVGSSASREATSPPSVVTAADARASP